MMFEFNAVYNWESDPLSSFYNLNGLQDIILTCDIDWAPDYAIEHVLEIVEPFNCKITMFSTHKSDILLRAPEFVEVGLHPDYTRRHSDSPFEEKIARLKEIYPDAKGTRSHRNFFGQNIADLNKKFGLIYDVSVILWNQPYCQAHLDYNGMVRFSYMWEDGLHLDMGYQLNFDQVNLFAPGLKIMNIHPILIYLNSTSESHRRSVTQRYADLTKAPKSDIDQEVFRGFGIKDLWINLLKMIKDNGIRTHCLSDLANISLRSNAAQI